jgi:hypothetical protein
MTMEYSKSSLYKMKINFLQNFIQMKKSIILFFLISQIFTFFSCIPEPLEIKIPPSDPKIVISSQFLKDSGVVVSCTRTFSALSDNYLPNKINIDFINNTFGLHSLVLLEHAGQTDTLYNMGFGFYYNQSLKFDVGQNCNLNVYDSIINQSITTNAVYIQNINFDTVFVEIEINDTDTNAIVYYTITDLPEQNYYLVNHYIFQNNQGSFDYTEFLGSNPYADLIAQYIEESEYNEILSRFSSIGGVDIQMEMIKDDDFQSQTIMDSVKFENISLNDTLAVSVANISKEYNDYLEIRLKAGSIYSQLMSDPISMPSNIEGGYGMFTTHSLNIWTIDLSRNAEITRFDK